MKTSQELFTRNSNSSRLGFLGALFVIGMALSGLAGCSGSPTAPPPVLPSASSLPQSCMAGAVGSNYSCQISVTSGNSPFTWAAAGLPKGLSLVVSTDTTSATISGTIGPLGMISRAGAIRSAITPALAGDPTTSASVTVTVTDAKGRSASVTFSITVTFPALAISTNTLVGGTAGTAYSATVTAWGGIAPYTWTITGLPAGLSPASATPSATISGTTNNVGTFSVTAKVSDSESPAVSASVTLSLTIAQATKLAISTTTLPGGTVNAAYSQTLAATGGVTPYSWSLASGTLPTGLTLSATGVISGTPTATGTFSFGVKATDAETPAQSSTQALSITIAAPALSVTTTSLPSGVVGKAYVGATLQSSGGQPPVTWSISVGTLPAGLNLNASTGAISGTPTTAGSSTITVKATDSSTPTPQTATKQLTIQISAALAISTTSPLPGGTAGTAYSATVTATGGTTPYSWTITGLPAGLTVTSGTPSATISGTTDHVGTFSVTAMVSDSESPAATVSTTLSLTTVQAATLMISTTTLPNGTVSSSYSQTLAATGGVTPYTWSVASGTLPAGLTLSSAGVLSGTPTATGTSSFTVQAADAEIPAQSVTQALSLTINAVTAGLNITTTSPLANGTLSTAYSATITASGGTPPYTWTLGSGSTLPAGLSLTSGSPSATIAGTPTVTGTYQFTLDVKDSASTPATASASFLLTISGSTSLNCPATVNLTLCGAYGLGIQGFVGTTGPAVMGASFLADNSGHIVSGVEDVNSVSGGQANVSITGGSYVMDTSGDGRGVLTLIDSKAGSRTFRFVLESAANPGIGAIEEFDASGTLAGGVLAGPGTLPFASIPANTIFAIVLNGYNGAGQRAGMIGEFQVGSSGCNGASGSFNSLTGEHVITNTAGTVNTALTVTGSCTAPDPNTGRGAIQITISGGTPYTNSTLNFFYYASGTATSGLQGVLVGEADAIGANQPILSGLAEVASSSGGGFASCASPAACILAGHGTTDGTITTGQAVAFLVRAVGTPVTGTTGTVAGVLDENFGGTITSAGTWPYTAYADDANGVGTLTGTGPTIHFVQDGQFMDESASVITGDINIQNTTTIENPGAAYIFGESIGSSAVGATPSVPHVAGVVISSGTTTGTYSGSLDISSSAGLTVGFTPSGSYTINSTTGRGTGTANFTGGASSVSVVIYGNRHRRFSVLDVQSSNPFLLGARLQ
jgi:hypothetical protein